MLVIFSGWEGLTVTSDRDSFGEVWQQVVAELNDASAGGDDEPLTRQQKAWLSLVQPLTLAEGFALLTVPIWVRMWRDLGAERAARVLDSFGWGAIVDRTMEVYESALLGWKASSPRRGRGGIRAFAMAKPSCW